MGRIVVYCVALSLLAVGGWFGYALLFSPAPQSGGHGGGGGPGSGGGRPTFVMTVPVSQTDFAVRIDAVGTAKARESVTITAKTADTISAINFRDGQTVPKGYVIVEMSSSQQSAQLAEARAALAEAQAQFDRAQRLTATGTASRAFLDQRRATRDTMTARVKAQESQVADRLIRAPFKGVLGLRQVSLGSLVRPGDPIVTLDDVVFIKLDLTVPETSLSFVREGMTVTARAASFPELEIQGTVTGIDSRVDPVARTVLVRAELPNMNDAIKPGMLLAAYLDADSRRALSVPEEAIVALGSDRFVFVPGADNKAERRPVKTGRRKPGFVEIVDGLRPGELVVTEGVVKLRPGAPITLTPPARDKPAGDRPSGGAGGSAGSRP